MNATTSYLIKEIDRFKSLNHKEKVISEFIIYTMADEIIVNADTMIGQKESIMKTLDYITSKCTVKVIPYEYK
jgi:hypothetical protein